MKYSEMAEKAKEKGASRDLTPVFLTFKDKGDHVTGKFLSMSPVDSSLSDGTYNQYIFETDDGLVKFHIGAATDKEVAPSLVVGRIYHIEYQGKERIQGGRSVNKFKVLELDPVLLDMPDEKKPLDRKGAKG